jgi:hypothetical protein
MHGLQSDDSSDYACWVKQITLAIAIVTTAITTSIAAINID